jgi:hypothetical protein
MVSQPIWWVWGPLMMIGMLGSGGCSGTNWPNASKAYAAPGSPSTFVSVLSPEPEDVPFFRAIAEDQEKKLGSCKKDDECRAVHFLRGLAALYENRELAAMHFRKVVVSSPNSVLAGESRFWLWLLDELNSPGGGKVSSQGFTRRLIREIVEKELLVHELTGQLKNASVEALQQELALREKAVEELNEVVASLSKQTEQLKKEEALRQEIQQKLKAREQKVQELTNQLEALRRIDQEIREKASPTRSSDKMVPPPELEKTGTEKESNHDREGTN